MKPTFFRKTVTSVCIAALLSAASPAFSADTSSSSIEINLDVLENIGKPKPAPVVEKAEKAPEKKKAAPAKPKQAATAPHAKKHAEDAAKKPAAAKHEKHAKPAAAPAPTAETPAPVATPATPTPELPPVKDLPPELTPSNPPLSVAPDASKPAEHSLPPTPPEVPHPDDKGAKGGLGDQLSNFINGKEPAALPTAPGAPSSETPPALPSTPMGSPLPDANLETPPAASATPATPPAPTGMNIEAIPSLPTATPPAAAPTTPELPAAPATAATAPALPTPAAPAATPPELPTPPAAAATPPELPIAKAPLPTAAEAGSAPAIPAAPPVAPASPIGLTIEAIPAEPVGNVTPPALPKGEPSALPTAPAPLPLPDSSSATLPAGGTGKSLPPLSAITTDEEKPEEKPEVKNAELPDLSPLPDNAKGELPSLPSGRQSDLLSAHTTTKSAAKDGASPAGEIEAKANASDPDARLVFNETETDVPASLTGQLDSLAQRLTKHPKAHINIFSYAGGKKENGIYPKRVSLARGIAVRNYLTSTKGIDIERVNVRALGNKSESGPNERVDLFIVEEEVEEVITPAPSAN